MLKAMNTEGIVARRRAKDPWRKTRSVYPCVACTVQATRRGVQETRRAGLEPVVVYTVVL